MYAETTQVSLLLRIRDLSDAGAWREFAELYTPLIEAFGKLNGLQESDAADLVQDVLGVVARKIGTFEYDRRLGRFRSLLFRVSRLCLLKLLEARKLVGTGDSGVQQMLLEQPARLEERSWWDAEYEQHLFDWAARKVEPRFRPKTWQAFWKTAVDGRAIEVAAAELDMSVGAVHIARSRVIAAFQHEIDAVGDEN